MVDSTWFVMIWRLQFCSGILNAKGGEEWVFYSDVVRYSSTNCRQAHGLLPATEQGRLYKDDEVASLGSNPRQPTNKSRNFPPTKYGASKALVFCLISQGPQPDSIPLA